MSAPVQGINRTRQASAGRKLCYTATPHSARELRLASSGATYQAHSRCWMTAKAQFSSTSSPDSSTTPPHTLFLHPTPTSILHQPRTPALALQIHYHIHLRTTHHGNILRVALVALLHNRTTSGPLIPSRTRQLRVATRAPSLRSHHVCKEEHAAHRPYRHQRCQHQRHHSVDSTACHPRHPDR